MASPQKPVKPASRWNFLQQAVASVESRLDTILADEEDPPTKAVPQAATPKRGSNEFSRSISGAQQNDRLQGRLARAMAAKKAAIGSESPLPPSEESSRASTPVQITQQPLDTAWVESSGADGQSQSEAQERTSGEGKEAATWAAEDASAAVSSAEAADITAKPFDRQTQPASDLVVSSQEVDSLPRSQQEGSEVAGSKTQSSLELPARLTESPSLSFESAQQEINGYIERIDALQAKLAYLTKEATQSARDAATSAGKGSLERAIAEKDEKISMLLEEGQRLSKGEMKQLASIRKMRAEVVSLSKEQSETKARAEKATRDFHLMEERAKRAELASKRAEEALLSSVGSTQDLEAMSRERQALTAAVDEMKGQLTRAHARAEQAEERAHLNQFEKEKKRAEQLQDELTGVRMEREVSEDKLQREIKDLQAAVKREKEHVRVMETEMLGEQAVLESKLESFRARAEEASSSDSGDTHAKLLRQIETLQTQYTTASQNWKGIEGTLLTRIATLEKERDEVVTRETDLRKRLRDVSLKSKQKDRHIEDLEAKLSEAERRAFEAQDEAQRSNRRVQELLEEAKQAKQELQDQRVQAEKEMNRRIEEEKSKFAAASSTTRLDSPGLPGRKISGFETIGQLMSPVLLERPRSRRSSNMPGPTFNSYTPPRQASTTSVKGLSNGNLPETPSIIMSMDDEYFEQAPTTPASPNHTASNSRGVHDIISTSTVGAGPSVQLVERMSANVRRLESEKAASKDELIRLTTQRDEARQELVSLMKEVEQKRSVDEKLKKLEDEHLSLNQRHQTTLEMLGEKSEMVDELKADVADVKAMYRELVDTIGRK